MNNTPSPSKYLPISAFQKLMIATALDPEMSMDYHRIMTLGWAFRITPGVSIRTLQRAVKTLAARHDSLRLRFVDNNGDWKAEILPSLLSGVITHDLSTLSEPDQISAISDKANQPLTALSEQMFEIHLLKCGSYGDVVLAKVHHAIIDGYGMVLLIEDLLKSVMNMPNTGPAMTHEQFMTYRTRHIREAKAKNDSFWQKQLLPPPADLRIGRVTKGLPPASARTTGPSISVPAVFTPSQSKSLEILAKNTGLSAFSYMHAAFSETICDLAGQDEVLINSTLGRQDRTLATFIGAEMQEVAIRFTQTSAGIHAHAQQVQDSISAAAEAIPTDIFFTPGNALAQKIKGADTHCVRFFVHNFIPTGRLSNSPFKMLFQKAMDNKVSLGFVSLERITLPFDLAFAELILSIYQTPDGPNASLASTPDSFSLPELQSIAESMALKLDQ